jgi:predicted secreted protein
MHEVVKEIIEKYKEKHQEVEEYLRGQGDTQIEYSPEHVKSL